MLREDIGFTNVHAMFILRQQIERKLEYNIDSMWAFLDLEKAYHKVDRRLIAPILRTYRVPEQLIKMVMALYRDPITKIRT